MGFMPTEWNLYNQSFCGLLALCFIVQYSTRADPDPEVGPHTAHSTHTAHTQTTHTHISS